MASKIFVFIATLAGATCHPLSQTVCETQNVPNFLGRSFPYMPYPGRNIFNPATTVCETSTPLIGPSTTCCESTMPSICPMPNVPTTTLCESTPTYNPMMPLNPSTTTVCESTPNIPAICPGSCHSNYPVLPNMCMHGLGLMPGCGMAGLGMPSCGLSGLGMPSLLMNGLGMSGLSHLGLGGLMNMGLPMPLITNLLGCLGC